MQFPYNVFSDLLAEFQKYLTSRIPPAVYWTLGLVVSTLGVIIVYITGWNNLLGTWNRLDIFFKLALSAGSILIFLLAAYILGSLQGMVERWFQGDWPFRLEEKTGRLQRQRRIWLGRENAFQEMTDLYGKLSAALENITTWGQWQDPEKLVVQATRPISRYTIITAEDLATAFVENAPAEALQDLASVVGTMAQSPLDAGALLKKSDILCLPAAWNEIIITALAVPPEIVPLGLLPGDMIVIYAQQKDGRLIHLNASLLVAIQHIKKPRADYLHLTLAIASTDIEPLTAISDTQIVRMIRLNAQRTGTSSAQASRSTPQTTPVTLSSPADEAITRQLEQLKQQYEEGEQWLKRLQAGIRELEVPDHLQTLNEAFALLEQIYNSSDPSSPGKDQLAKWRGQITVYRNKWISLLQDAFNETKYHVDQNQKAFSLYYPSTLEKVAPTVIGNVFRAVDSYCDTLYGVDSALVLPRLHAVMAQSTHTQLSKAHDQLALLEWLYLGSITVGMIGTPLAFVNHHYLLAFLLWFMALPVPRLFFYSAAVSAALDYAAALRLAVDRERGKVIKMAGFSLPSPINQEQEKALWKEIQQWWVYGTSPANYTIAIEGESNEKDR